MSLYVKPRPWQEVAIEIIHEKDLDKAIELARELLRALETKEQPKNTTNSSAKGATFASAPPGPHGNLIHAVKENHA